MAYLSEVPSTRRYATLGAVAALHGGLAIVLLTTFAGGVLVDTVTKYLPTQMWPAKPIEPQIVPPPPSDTPSTSATPDTKVVAPKSQVTFTLRPEPIDTVIDLGPLPPIGGTGRDVLVVPTPSPSPTARFAPKGAAPQGNPGQWVTTNDYPTDAIRRGEAGTTTFRLTVGPDGRVRDCTVTKSSGSASLDAAACSKMSQRARFRPATDGDGDAVAGSWTNSVKWVLPD